MQDSSPKRIRASFLEFFPPGEPQAHDFIDKWHFTVDDTPGQTPARPTTTDVAPVRRLESVPSSVRVAREDLIEMRRSLMQSANAIDGAIEMIDAVLDVRRTA